MSRTTAELISDHAVAQELRRPSGRVRRRTSNATADTFRRLFGATREVFDMHPGRSARNIVVVGTMDGGCRTLDFARRDADGLVSSEPGLTWTCSWFRKADAKAYNFDAAEAEAYMVRPRKAARDARRANVANMREARREARAAGFRPAWG